jgi:hypothetical protein
LGEDPFLGDSSKNIHAQIGIAASLTVTRYTHSEIVFFINTVIMGWIIVIDPMV